MSDIIKQEKLIWTDIAENKNKEWHIIWRSDNSVETQWGRVGETLKNLRQPYHSESSAEAFYNRMIRSKLKKGYHPQADINKSVGSKVIVSQNLASIAHKELNTNAETKALVDMLIKANAHEIVTSTNLKYNNISGLFTTDVGTIISAEGITKAKDLLPKIARYVNNKNYSSNELMALVNEYLQIVPQKITRVRPTIEKIFPDNNSLSHQYDILDALDSSLKMVMSDTGDQQPKEEKVFQAKLHLVKDDAVIDRIKKMYWAKHDRGHDCQHLRPTNIYAIEIDAMTKSFEGCKNNIGNIQELWHGSRTCNLLSIIKSGMFIASRNSGIQITGRLFGPGLYFSDSSTKALNYSYGYWSGGSRSEHCFAFIADVALGKQFIPHKMDETYPKPGFNSTWAKKGYDYSHYHKLRNDEMIVYNANQINLKYLVEFSA